LKLIFALNLEGVRKVQTGGVDINEDLTSTFLGIVDFV
jgi:hypothetical protein